MLAVEGQQTTRRVPAPACTWQPLAKEAQNVYFLPDLHPAPCISCHVTALTDLTGKYLLWLERELCADEQLQPVLLIPVNPAHRTALLMDIFQL